MVNFGEGAGIFNPARNIYSGKGKLGLGKI